MKIIFLIHVLFFCGLVSACSNDSVAKNNNSTVNFSNSQNKRTDDKQSSELRNKIEQIASAAKGRVGVAAAVLETGESISLDGAERFPMQSVYKVPIAMAVLQQADAGKIKLDERVRFDKSDFVRKEQYSPIRDRRPDGGELSVGELLRFMVSHSDGSACDILLDLVGGTETVAKFLNEIKVNDVIVVNTEKEIGRDWETQYRNWASPEGALRLLRALHERRGISPASQELLLKLMRETPIGLKRLKGLLPEDADVAHKTGTSGTKNGITAAANDIGIIALPGGRHLAVAVFIKDSAADEAARDEVTAKIARAIWDEFSK